MSILYSSVTLSQKTLVWWTKRAIAQLTKKSFVRLGPGIFFVAKRKTSSADQMSPSKASRFSITATRSFLFKNSQDFSKILSCVWYDSTLMILKHSAVSLGLNRPILASQGLGTTTQHIRTQKTRATDVANDFLSTNNPPMLAAAPSVLRPPTVHRRCTLRAGGGWCWR